MGSVMLAVIVLVLLQSGFQESFVTGYNDTIENTNRGPEPWNHHKVNALPASDLPVRYPKAYYYELNNTDFQQALSSAFNLPAAGGAGQDEEWGPTIFGVDIMEAYTTVINLLTTTLIEKAYLFRLPDSTSPPCKVIHDVLTSVYVNTNKPQYLMNIDVVLYREAKYQAKSVHTVCVVDASGDKPIARFVEMKVVGVISEGDFGLFPVVGMDLADDAAFLGSVPPSDRRN